MLSRPVCPGVDVPADLEECLARCFEAHRRRVLERRAARRQARKLNQKTEHQQSSHAEQYQHLPPQPPSHYSNLTQESQQYQDFLPQSSEPTSHYSNLIQESQQYQYQPPQTSEPHSHYSNITQESQQYQDFLPHASEPPSNYSNITQESQQYQDFLPHASEPTSHYSNLIQESQQYQYQPPQTSEPPSNYSNITQESQQYQDFLPQSSEPTSHYSNLIQESQQYQDFLPQSSEPSSYYSNLIQESQQYQNLPPQPAVTSADYSNLIKESQQYQQLLEPTDTTLTTEISQRSTFEHSNIDQSTTVPIDTPYKAHIASTSEPYRHLKEVQYTSPQITPSFTNTYEQTQISSEFKESQGDYIQPSETIAYTNENTQYQAPASEVFDSHITNQQLEGSSIPTGTVEYTKQAYYSEEPISNQSDNISYLQQIQSSDNHQYVNNNTSPPATVQTYDLNNYTNEQTVPQQTTVTSYEENQQTISNKPVRSPSSSDNGSNEDAREDEEILDLRACICRCYAKFKDSWVKNQQERYQEQFRDIKQPAVQINNQQFQRIHQRIPTPVPTYTQPPSIPHYQPPTPVPSYTQPYPPVHTYAQPPTPIPSYNRPPTPVHTYTQPPTPVPSYAQPPIPVHTYTQPPTPVPSYNQPPTPVHTYAQPPTPVPSYNQPPIPVHTYTQPPTPVPSYNRPPTPVHTYTQPPTPVPTYTQPPSIPRYQPPTPVPSYTQPPSIPHYQPPIPTSVPPGTQQIIQQSNTFLSIHCDHKEQPEPLFETSEIDFADATTQTRSLHTPIQPHIPQQTYEQPSYIPQTIPIDFQQESETINNYSPFIPETPQIVPPSPAHVPSYDWSKSEQEKVYNPIIPTASPQPHYTIPIRPPQLPSIPVPIRPCPGQYTPRIDSRTGLCLVPCPETIKSANLPCHLRSELFCVELPPQSSLPPPRPRPPPAVAQSHRWCVKCCCVPGKSLIKKITYRQIEDEKQHEEESYVDYASIIDQLETKITVRYGNSIMEEGDAFISGNYNEQLRIIDFPVYVSGKDDTNLTRLVPHD